MEPKLLDCCKPEHVGTKKTWQNGKTNSDSQRGQVPAKEAKNRKIEGQKRRIAGKEKRRLLNEFEMGGFMAQKGLWNHARDKMLQDRDALPKQTGDVIREYKAMHEENFLSSWLREDVEGKEERKKMEKEAREVECRGGKRKEEKEEEATVVEKRRCDTFSQGGVRRVVGIRGVVFWVTLVVSLIVGLWPCRVRLMRLMCLCRTLETLWNRSLFLSPESVEPFVWRIKKT